MPRERSLRVVSPPAHGPAGGAPRPALRSATPAVPGAERLLRIADVAIFYGERSGGIRTYLQAKAAFARRTGAFEHHLVVPGRPQAAGDDAHRHEQRSLQLAASNGYRIPLGSGGLISTLRALAPDVVMLHDPFWNPRLSCRCAHELGAIVIAVHHSSAALHAAGLPGPQDLYKAALRRWYRRAYLDVDAVMSVVDPGLDARRASTLQLRLGLDPAFKPQADAVRSDHVLYVGRLSREKGIRELLEAAAASSEPWELVLLGAGPAGDALSERAGQLAIGSRVTFAPYLSDRDALAREYARASCVVLPGAYETFGLAALEAGACGATVVTASCSPVAALLDACVETFTAGDPDALLHAITRARARTPDLRAAHALVSEHGWHAALQAELADVRRLAEQRSTAAQAAARRLREASSG
ncbi:MAG: glycosyltransferase [Solirubrobacteraceae bacterium]